MSLPFVKMNGLGNDFVIVVVDGEPFEPTPERARTIADRQAGVGCDQLIAIGRSKVADAAMRIWNADGGEVEACGNASRCIAWLIMEATDREHVTIETAGGVLAAHRDPERPVTIDMGEPRLAAADIPLAWAMDTADIPIRLDGTLGHPGCVNVGNPHVVFFVDDVETAPVRTSGPALEAHWLFPERANVGFAQVMSRDHIRLKVWERGVGQTRACGTGACAALVAAHRRGLTDRVATVELDGGPLNIEWRESDGHLLMTGPVAVEFRGWLPGEKAGD